MGPDLDGGEPDEAMVENGVTVENGATTAEENLMDYEWTDDGFDEFHSDEGSMKSGFDDQRDRDELLLENPE